METSKVKELNNGVKMPVVGLGLWRSEGEDTPRSVRYAVKAGYRHLDGAKAYGNEKGVGEGIRQSGIKREDLFVTTKLWNSDMRKNAQIAGFEKSLKDMRLDYLDLYLIHWPVENFSASWKVLEEIYKSGKARAVGVCNIQIHHLETLFKTAEIIPAVNQFECHPLLSQKPLIDYCVSKGIACEAYSPLGGEGSKLHSHPVLIKIAESKGKSSAQIMLRWNLQRGLIVIPKSVKKERIESNIQLFDFELTAEDMAAIDAINKNERFCADPDNFNF
jgi:diketogulonate reductase-like aldo/keto reductase